MSEKHILDKLVKHFIDKSPRNNLLSIFECEKVEQVVNHGLYLKYYDLVSGFYNKIYLVRDENPENSLYNCLYLIKDEKYSNDAFADHAIDNKISRNIIVIDKLIRKGIYTSWTPQIKHKYEIVYDMLTTWNDFFFSYTNRNAHETNSDFRCFINNILSNAEAPNNLLDEINFLARAIVKKLENQGLKSFYDYKNLKCGDDIEKEILIHCKNSFAFVQLTEEVLFIEPEGKKENWCYNELIEFDNSCSTNSQSKDIKRYFFCVCKESIEPEKPYHNYNEWIRKVRRLRYMDFKKGIGDCDVVKKEEICKEIRELAREIIDCKEKMIECAIESLCC